MGKNKRKKNKQKKISKTGILKKVLFFVLLVYVIYMLVRLIKNPTDTFMVENGKVSMEEDAICYIIKEETILSSENSEGNKIKIIKSEGTKVSGGESVFSYISSYNEEIKTKIEELDAQISESLKNQTDKTSSDIKVLESNIKSEAFEVTELNDIQAIMQNKKNIASNMEKRTKIIGKLSGTKLENLISTREKYQNQLTSTSETVKTSVSGIVSYRVDGLENVLTIDSIENLNSETLENLNLKTGELPASSDTQAKVINNLKCYLAVTSNSNEAMEAKVGQSAQIRLSDGTEIDVKISNIIEENDKRLIIFEIRNNIDKIINYRKISIDIIWWSKEGLKIPLESIKNEREVQITDGEQPETIKVGEITKIRTGYNQIITVKILKENEKYVLIKNLTNSEFIAINSDKNEDEIENQGSIILYDEILRKNK